MIDINTEQLDAIEELYNKKIKSGENWEKIIKEVAAESEETAKQLIKYRDIVDYELYCKIVEDLFSTINGTKKFFEITKKNDGKISKDEQGHYSWNNSLYVIKIYNSRLSVPNRDDDPCCTVKINAPGSRNLTSDIDTTISVIDAENLKEANFPYWLKNKGPAYNGRIVNQIIKEFNKRRLEKYKVTSATALDSNVYAKGFLGKHIKFNWKDVKKSLKIENEILPFENDINFFNKYREIKHIQEQAASLFLLREVFNDSKNNTPTQDWTNFINKVKKINEEFNDEEQQQVIEFFNKVIKEIESIYVEYQKLLFPKEKELKEKELKENLQQKNEKNEKNEKKEKAEQSVNSEIKITAMNELYFNQLEKVVDYDCEIMKLPIKEIPTFLKKLKEAENNRSKQERILEKWKEDEDFKDRISEQERVCANSSLKIKEIKEKIGKILSFWADFQNKKQRAQIIANTFAIEAYTNWGAPYHVVKGMQSNELIKLSKDAIMGSCLQQIGFRLLHSRNAREQKKTEEEIALKFAKYGQRIADLIFGQYEHTYNVNDIKKLKKGTKGNFLNILVKLDDSFRDGGHVYFTEEEYLLLNSEIEIALLKKKPLLEDEKLKMVKEILAKRPFKIEKEQELFLSIASKMIVATNIAKLAKNKKLQEQTQTVSPQITHQLDHTKEKDKQPLIKKNNLINYNQSNPN